MYKPISMDYIECGGQTNCKFIQIVLREEGGTH